MKLISDPAELDFRNEYDTHLNVYLGGVPFTGILKEKYEQVEYKEGNAIHVIQYYENGQKRFEEILKKRTQSESFSWYEDGSIKSEFKFDHLFYQESGTVLTTGYELYPDGKLASKSENGFRRSFAENGNLILESKSTPEEKYHKEYYLNGVLKFHRLPAIKKSFHYSDKKYLIIDQDENYGRSSIYFNEVIIGTYIHELFFSEGQAFGFSTHADGIRTSRLTSWLVTTVQKDKPEKYLSLNFKLCFCKNKKHADYGFKRFVNKITSEEIEHFRIPEIVGIEFQESTKMLERLKTETNKKNFQ